MVNINSTRDNRSEVLRLASSPSRLKQMADGQSALRRTFLAFHVRMRRVVDAFASTTGLTTFAAGDEIARQLGYPHFRALAAAVRHELDVDDILLLGERLRRVAVTPRRAP